MNDGAQCMDARRVAGVNVQCHRPRGHKGPHQSSTYKTRWNESGQMIPAPITVARSHSRCQTADCNLWLDHAGPHGQQLALAL